VTEIWRKMVVAWWVALAATCAAVLVVAVHVVFATYMTKLTTDFPYTRGSDDREWCDSYCGAADGVLVELRSGPRNCVCAFSDSD